MYTNVNLAAPIGALAFLGTGLLFLIAGFAFLYTVVKGELVGTKSVLSATAIVTAIYLGFVLLFSFTSSNQVLARGQEKHFCEIDCHLAYSIVDVRQTKTLGNGPNQATAHGLYHVVTLKTRFDEDTISSTRGNGPLTPNSRLATVIDAQGRRYGSSAEGERAVAQSEGAGTPLTTVNRTRE
jgi:energy-coupling factor transporter transmembrane protein EcfT